MAQHQSSRFGVVMASAVGVVMQKDRLRKQAAAKIWKKKAKITMLSFFVSGGSADQSILFEIREAEPETRKGFYFGDSADQGILFATRERHLDR